ncbi:hypothetical protein AAMO2058_001463000 [Amorphochlora amoebiformis]|eukprot:1335777-Amorphochlora_amoeboformis.AAC.1
MEGKDITTLGLRPRYGVKRRVRNFKQKFAQRCFNRMRKDRDKLMDKIRRRSRGESAKHTLNNSIVTIISEELNDCVKKDHELKDTMDIEEGASPRAKSSARIADMPLSEEELQVLLKDLEEQMLEDPLVKRFLEHEQSEEEALQAEICGFVEDDTKRGGVLCPFCFKSNWELKRELDSTLVQCKCGLLLQTPPADENDFCELLGNAYTKHGMQCTKQMKLIGSLTLRGS